MSSRIVTLDRGQLHEGLPTLRLSGEALVGALIWRENRGRDSAPAYWVSAVLYVAALTAFVVVWGDGIPVGGRSIELGAIHRVPACAAGHSF
jgi:hypothetical protein